MSLLSQFLDPTWCPLGSFTWLQSSVSLARVQTTKKSSLTCLAPRQGGLKITGDWLTFSLFFESLLKAGPPFLWGLSLSLNRLERLLYMASDFQENKNENCQSSHDVDQNGPSFPSNSFYCWKQLRLNGESRGGEIIWRVMLWRDEGHVHPGMGGIGGRICRQPIPKPLLPHL